MGGPQESSRLLSGREVLSRVGAEKQKSVEAEDQLYVKKADSDSIFQCPFSPGGIPQCPFSPLFFLGGGGFFSALSHPSLGGFGTLLKMDHRRKK